MSQQKIIIVLIVAILVASMVAWGGSYTGQVYAGIPIFSICIGLAFIINWLAFIPANIKKTEHFYDLTGSLTYISTTAAAIYFSQNLDMRSLTVASMVIIWATRLGSFLFIRISKDGRDDRFDSIKINPLRFFNAWTLQALWVSLTAAAALITITSIKKVELDAFFYVGLALWLGGFVIEVIADSQKRSFKKDPANKRKFISSGLWSKSRHPNYFGEITLWFGIFVISIPVLTDWQWVALLSPIFVTFLLTKVSGLPMLEAKADKKWGGRPDYEAYKANTPILVPKL